MTSRLNPHTIVATTSAFSMALLLAACGTASQDEPEEDTGGGAADGGMDQVQAMAPDPTGDQHSHGQMREALEESIDGAEITDTDDWWESLRDVSRELQKLRVDPTDCKSFVTASAQPIPAGALAAIAQHDQRQTAAYSFEDADEAQIYVNQEFEGAELCDEHTVTRELSEDEEIETESTLEEVEVLSGAEDALAVSHVLDVDDDTQRSLTVLLRYGSTVVANAATLQEPLDEDGREDLTVDLEAEAAAVLSTLTGEEIVEPEPEPEPEDEDSDEETPEDGDSDEDSDEDSETDETDDEEADSED